jgi:hypothetical protein
VTLNRAAQVKVPAPSAGFPKGESGALVRLAYSPPLLPPAPTNC